MLRKPPKEQGERLVEKWMPQLEALELSVLQRPLLTGERAEALTEGLVRHFVTVTPLALKAFTREQWKEYGGVWISMHERLWVFVSAEQTLLDTLGTQGTRYLQLVQEVGGRLQGLLPWAQLLAAADEEIAQTLADLQHPRDLRDPADEAVRLVSLFRASQDLLAPALSLPEEALLPLDQAAEELLLLREAAAVGKSAKAQDTLTRAYAFWLQAYKMLVAMAQFFKHDEPLFLKRFPEPLPLPIPPLSPR